MSKCPMCNSINPVPLGTLGNLAYFRCRACGWEFSVVDDEIDENVVVSMPGEREAVLVWDRSSPFNQGWVIRIQNGAGSWLDDVNPSPQWYHADCGISNEEKRQLILDSLEWEGIPVDEEVKGEASDIPVRPADLLPTTFPKNFATNRTGGVLNHW